MEVVKVFGMSISCQLSCHVMTSWNILWPLRKREKRGCLKIRSGKSHRINLQRFHFEHFQWQQFNSHPHEHELPAPLDPHLICQMLQTSETLIFGGKSTHIFSEAKKGSHIGLTSNDTCSRHGTSWNTGRNLVHPFPLKNTAVNTRAHGALKSNWLTSLPGQIIIFELHLLYWYSMYSYTSYRSLYSYCSPLKKLRYFTSILKLGTPRISVNVLVILIILKYTLTPKHLFHAAFPSLRPRLSNLALRPSSQMNQLGVGLSGFEGLWGCGVWIPTIRISLSACDSGGAKMTFTDTEHSSPGSLAIKIKRFSNKRSGSLSQELSFRCQNSSHILSACHTCNYIQTYVHMYIYLSASAEKPKYKWSVLICKQCNNTAHVLY